MALRVTSSLPEAALASNPGTVVERDLQDSTVFLYTLGTCVVTALIAGLFPAWQASRAGVHLGPRTMTHSRRQSYARRSLVLVQVTLAVVLLFGAVLFAHSLHSTPVPLARNVQQ